jgi:hypothetical protein
VDVLLHSLVAGILSEGYDDPDTDDWDPSQPFDRETYMTRGHGRGSRVNPAWQWCLSVGSCAADHSAG